MNLRRAANASPEALTVLTEDVTEMITNGDVTLADVQQGCDRFGRQVVADYEPRFPDIATLDAVIRNAARDRRIVESNARALGDGRRPGESLFDFHKRQYEEERASGEPQGPSAEERERFARLFKSNPMPTAKPVMAEKEGNEK
jgi:hypothetical protein